MTNAALNKESAKQVTGTIAVSGTSTGEINLAVNESLVGLFIPSNLTGTVLTFQASNVAGGTYGNIIDSTGASISKTVSAGKFLSFTADDIARFRGVSNLKIISGTSQATSPAIITLALREL